MHSSRYSDKKKYVLSSKGIVKCAILVRDPNCKDLFEIPFYNSKTVYFIINACKSVQWNKKARKLWHQEKGKNIEVLFYRLSIVDEYNFGMGDVDQADQLCLQYLFHY